MARSFKILKDNYLEGVQVDIIYNYRPLSSPRVVTAKKDLIVHLHDSKCLQLDCPWSGPGPANSRPGPGPVLDLDPRSGPGPVRVQTWTQVLQCNYFLKNYLSLIFIYI